MRTFHCPNAQREYLRHWPDIFYFECLSPCQATLLYSRPHNPPQWLYIHIKKLSSGSTNSNHAIAKPQLNFTKVEIDPMLVKLDNPRPFRSNFTERAYTWTSKQIRVSRKALGLAPTIKKLRTLSVPSWFTCWGSLSLKSITHYRHTTESKCKT